MVSALLNKLEPVSRIVISMELIISNSNVSSVAVWLNGFVGAILIFANPVTQNKIMEIMFLENQRMNCLNALV